MARLLAPEDEASIVQSVQDVSVSHIRTLKPDPIPFKGSLEPKIREHSPDDGVPSESLLTSQSRCQNEEHDVTRNSTPHMIDHDDPVAVPVMRNAQVRALGEHAG